LLGWRIPSHTDLAVYFGRCLGAIALVLNVAAARAGLAGVAVAEIMAIIFLIAVLMVFVHAWGAIRKIQPIMETIEIGFWALIALAALAFWPSA
jgi:predicted transporter